MTGPVLIKGQIRVTLPLKTSASARKSASTSPKEQQRKLQAIQSWEDLNTDAASHVTLALKKRVHQFHRHQAQRRALSSTSIRVHSPPVDPFSSWPIEPTPFVPRMAQYCEFVVTIVIFGADVDFQLSKYGLQSMVVHFPSKAIRIRTSPCCGPLLCRTTCTSKHWCRCVLPPGFLRMAFSPGQTDSFSIIARTSSIS